jgi:hypothetical protein
MRSRPPRLAVLRKFRNSGVGSRKTQMPAITPGFWSNDTGLSLYFCSSFINAAASDPAAHRQLWTQQQMDPHPFSSVAETGFLSGGAAIPTAKPRLPGVTSAAGVREISPPSRSPKSDPYFCCWMCRPLEWILG